MSQAGIVLDVFDDPDLSVLSSALGDRELPEIIKTAHPITPEQLPQLVDEDFAMVMADAEGTTQIRKFACPDPGHTALSCAYFHETRRHLDDDSQLHVAANLLEKCAQFGLPTASLEAVILELAPELAEDDQEKTASVSYFDESPIPPHTNHGRTIEEGDFLLSGRFPVRDYGEVKEAEAYFLEHGRRLVPEDRREFCVSLVKQASAMGVNLADSVVRYGSDSYGAEADMQILWRKEFVDADAHGVLEKLAAAIEVTPPDVMAAALSEFDQATGLDNLYGNHVADPYWSVFGPSLEQTKVAEYVWEQGAERCTGSDLVDLATNHRTMIENQFGADVADEFVKDPVTVFNAMPTPQKIILARAASDNG